MRSAESAYFHFLRVRFKDLKRIASSTRREATAEDLGQEAWAMAAELEERRDLKIDFNDPNHQDLILACLYNRFVKFSEKTVRFATKLDLDWEKGGQNLLDRILALCIDPSAQTNRFTHDPLSQLLDEEGEHELSAAVQQCYSEASAYLLLLIRFEWSAIDLAHHLNILVSTLRRRIGRVIHYRQIQRSLFDGIDSIDADFTPTVAPQVSDRVVQAWDGQQECLTF